MKGAGIISINEARTWLAALNIDMKDIEDGDIIPDHDMALMQLEEMEVNIENLRNPPEQEEEPEEVQASKEQTEIFPNVKNEPNKIVPVDSIQRVNADDMGGDGGTIPDQLMYPGLQKKKVNK